MVAVGPRRVWETRSHMTGDAMSGSLLRRGARRKILGAGAAALLGLAALPFLAGPASAAASVAPTDPFFGFPASYADASGVRLAPCLTAGMCPTSPPDATKPASVPNNFPAIGVYGSATANAVAVAV